MIRTGLIGFGLGGRIFHAPFISITPGLELTTVVQRGPWKQSYPSPQEQYPSIKLAPSAEALINDPEIDLVVISVPHDTHMPLATAALEAGKHIVIDKPVTPTAADCKQLLELAQKHNRIFAPFHNRRWDSDFVTVQKVLDSGRLGRLVTFTSNYDRYRPLQRVGTWKESAGPANGLLFDLGTHLIDQPLALFGKPDSVTANIRKDRDQTDIVDGFDIVLHYPRLTVRLNSTMVAADPSPRFLLHGTHGSFRKYGLDPQENAMLAGARPPAEGRWLPEPESTYGVLTTAPDIADPANLVHEVIPSEDGDYRPFYANVRDAILGRAPLTVTPEHAYRTMRVLELAQQSDLEKRTIPYDPSEW